MRNIDQARTGHPLGLLAGYRRLFLLGMASFAVTSLLAGLASTPTR